MKNKKSLVNKFISISRLKILLTLDLYCSMIPMRKALNLMKKFKIQRNPNKIGKKREFFHQNKRKITLLLIKLISLLYKTKITLNLLY